MSGSSALACLRHVGVVVLGALSANLGRGQEAPGVELSAAAMAARHEALVARLAAAAPVDFASGGLCGVRCVSTVRLTGSRQVRLRLPMPQLTAGQVPVLWTLQATPPEALHELRFRDDVTRGT